MDVTELAIHLRIAQGHANVKPARLHPSRSGIRRELFVNISLFRYNKYSLNSYSFSKSQSDYSSNGSYQRFISQQTGRKVTPSKRMREATTRSGNCGTEGIETDEAKNNKVVGFSDTLRKRLSSYESTMDSVAINNCQSQTGQTLGRSRNPSERGQSSTVITKETFSPQHF